MIPRALKFFGLVDTRDQFHFPTLMLAVAAARMVVPWTITLADGLAFFFAATLYAYMRTVEWMERAELAKRVAATAVPIGELEGRVKELEKQVSKAKLAGALGRSGG